MLLVLAIERRMLNARSNLRGVLSMSPFRLQHIMRDIRMLTVAMFGLSTCLWITGVYVSGFVHVGNAMSCVIAEGRMAFIIRVGDFQTAARPWIAYEFSKRDRQTVNGLQRRWKYAPADKGAWFAVGATVSVAYWSMCSAILLTSLEMVRRKYSRRRSQNVCACACCGYDISAIPGVKRCPECGESVHILV